jgi:DNA-binding NarL/FixJ family response regulator
VLGRALGQEDGLSVVGHAATESEIAETLRVAPPEVLLFDYEALGPNGEAVISRVRREFPKTRILVLATRSGPETVERVLHAGASGLVGKESDLLTLVRALRSVANGEIWANRRDTARALERLALVSGRHVGSAGTLTRRETEIVEWVGHGLRNKEIAHRLRINEKTVKTHLNNIFRKLHVDSRIALALLGASQPLPKT